MAYITLFQDGIFCSQFCRAAKAEYLDIDIDTGSFPQEYMDHWAGRSECAECHRPNYTGRTFTYLLAKPGTSENYLGFGARVCDDDTSVSQVIEIPDAPQASDPQTNAKWQQMRLASGLALMAQQLFTSYEQAITHREMLEAWERDRPIWRS